MRGVAKSGKKGRLVRLWVPCSCCDGFWEERENGGAFTFPFGSAIVH